MLVQKICKYCKGIIENAKHNQFYHKKEDDKKCYNNRMKDLSQKSTASYRKRYGNDPKVDKKVGTGWLGEHPIYGDNPSKTDFELEYKKICDEKHRLKIY